MRWGRGVAGRACDDRGMKTRVAVFVIAGALAACKGKPAPTTVAESPREAPGPSAECQKTAAHAMELMKAQMGDALSDADWPKVTAILEGHCAQDAWSAEAIDERGAQLRAPGDVLGVGGQDLCLAAVEGVRDEIGRAHV